MSIGSVSGIPPRKPPAAVNQEALRIGAALEHIKSRGNLDGFPAGRAERIALVSTAGKQGLVFWNRSRARYELTSRGHRHARALRRAGRNALRDRQGGAIRSGMNAVVTAAAAVVTVGAVFLAFSPAGPPNSAPLREAAGYFTRGAPVPAPAQAARSVEPRSESQSMTTAAGMHPKPIAAEQVAVVAPAGRVDAADPGMRIGPGEAAKSLAASIGSEPERVTDAAQKTAGDDRDRPETTKLAHKQKKSSRRGRHGDDERETRGRGYEREVRGPGYAYGPYGGAQRYGYWSSPWGYR